MNIPQHSSLKTNAINKIITMVSFLSEDLTYMAIDKVLNINCTCNFLNFPPQLHIGFY